MRLVTVFLRLAIATFWIPFVAAVIAADPVSFSRQIAPILADQCLECHREEKSKGSYRLDTFEQMLKPGDSEEPVIAAGQPQKSLLFTLLTAEDAADRMPKKADPLPPDQVALIRRWIAEGAKFDGKDAKALITAVMPEPARPQAPAKYPRPIPVTALALNGDGKVLATSGYHEVLLWDPVNGQLRGRLPGMPERVLAMAFVQGGPRLAVAGGVPGRSGELWLVDLAKPSERRRLVQMRDCALCAVVNRDGTRLYAGGADNRVRAFSLPDGKALWTAEAHADWVFALALRPDGKQLATASRDRTARLIDVADGTIDATFTGHAAPVLSLAFASDGQQIISGSSDGEVRFWDLKGVGRKDSTTRPAGRTEVLGLGFVDPATPVAACGNGQVHAVDSKTRRAKAKLTQHGDRVNAMILTGAGDSQRLITGSHDGEVRITGVKEAKEMVKFMASPGFP